MSHTIHPAYAIDLAIKNALYATHGQLTSRLFDGTGLTANARRRLARVRVAMDRIQCEELIFIRFKAAFLRKGRARRIAERKLGAAEDALFQQLLERRRAGSDDSQLLSRYDGRDGDGATR